MFTCGTNQLQNCFLLKLCTVSLFLQPLLTLMKNPDLKPFPIGLTFQSEVGGIVTWVVLGR